MADYLSTPLGALIGAIIGSVGAVFVQHWLTHRVEETRRREALAQRHLFQYQDAIESLWFRLDNITFAQGRYVMSDEYFETTTLYALGRALAVERIFSLEGIYSQIDASYPLLGTFLRNRRIDLELRDTNFYQYDRVSLAEAMIEREGDRYRTSTYLEFRRRYESEDSPEKKWLTPARDAIKSLDEASTSALLDSLYEVANRLSQETRVPSSLPKWQA